MSSTVRSRPTHPKGRIAVGNYAVQQNEADRSNAVLNELMDTKFRAIHEQYVALFERRTIASTAMTKAVAARNSALKELDKACSKVHRALTEAFGDGAKEIRDYLPGGGLGANRLPPNEQIAALQVYVPAIKGSDDLVIPNEVRDRFLNAIEAAKVQQLQVEALKLEMTELNQAQENADIDWDDSYYEYHATVEYQLKDSRSQIRQRILEYPAGRSRRYADDDD